jgi:transposase-like protein
MPRQQCSVCRHPQLQAIDAALASRTSVRAIAKQFGVSPAAVDRHHHHEDHAKNRINTEEIVRIDKEIRKLHFAQTAARKRRDNTVALQIARELRNWHTLRVKASAVSQAKTTQSEQLSRSEAIALAEALIESEVTAGNPEVIAWLSAVLERVQHMNKSEVNAHHTEPKPTSEDESVGVRDSDSGLSSENEKA